MTQPIYMGAGGRLVPGRRLGRGGEGEVFALEGDSPRALKIYTSPDAAREAKIRAMVSAGLAGRCPNVAFPLEAAYTVSGGFAGFVMPLVDAASPVHELCSPASRRRLFPNADWRFLVRTALNTARAFARVHDAGAVVGDVNASGVLVTKRALVALIDADSFQLGPEHLCRVGVPEFTPPELQGRSLDGVMRTTEHDGFGLAVLVFELLFNGRHPHAGISETRDIPLTDAITQNLFPYTTIRPTRLRPPPATLTLQDLPLGLATLFERAFSGVPPRPTAAEWISELQHLERSIVPCDRRPGHYMSDVRRDCPWCRIEERSGAVAFGHGVRLRPTGIAPLPPEIAPAYARVVERARAVGGEALRPPVPSTKVTPGPKARETLIRHGWTAGGRQPTLVPSHKAHLGKPFLDAFTTARRELEKETEAWRNRIGAWSLLRPAAELEAKVARVAATAARRSAEAADVERKVRRTMVEEKLALIPLTSLNVPGLGKRGVARLAAAGIANAAEVDPVNIRVVAGISERAATALMLWRNATASSIECEVTVRPGDVALEKARMVEEWRREDASIGDRMGSMKADLERDIGMLLTRASQPDPRMDEAIARYWQAEADLDHLGIDKPVVKAKRAPSPKTKIRKGSRTACPDCGGPMVKRWARAGSSPQRYYLGCARYPSCSGSRPIRRV